MAFFGLNFLGDYDVFGTAKAHKLERLTAIPESTFVETFRAMCMERTAPRLAREIQADGSALTRRPSGAGLGIGTFRGRAASMAIGDVVAAWDLMSLSVPQSEDEIEK